MQQNDADVASIGSEDRCPYCGAAVNGGRAGCQSQWEVVAVQIYGDLSFAAVRDLAFDAYCMQHPEDYCRSAKSYAAHLTRLCAGVEHNGDRAVYAAIQISLNGRVTLEKPEPPHERGKITILDVRAAGNGAEHQNLVRTWAQCVWQSYAPQHGLARNWIRLALARR